jgi:hypothetical protein
MHAMTHAIGAACRCESERGSALVVALLSLLLLTALGLALALTTASETFIAGHHRSGQQALGAADAVIERTMQDLLTIPDWDRVLAGAETSSFVDGAAGGTRVLPDGSQINLDEVANLASCGKRTTCSDADIAVNTPERSWGANNPRWRPFAYGPVNDLLPDGSIDLPFYVVVLVGDDPSETDNDPSTDGNTLTNPGSGVLSLRAEAFGPRGTHRVLETTVAKTVNTGQERGYVGQRGQDEQNRRARKAAVQTPGKALTTTELTMPTGQMP